MSLNRRIMGALVVVLFVAACGNGKARSARAPSTGDLLPSEEQALATAVEKKRNGDPIGAWKVIEDIPASSRARFDPRYTEVMGAFADARTNEIGAEITGKGGGPQTGVVEAEATPQPPRALSAGQIEDIIASKRGKLRAACYAENDKHTSFTLELRIDTGGHVLTAATDEVKGDVAVAECVRSHAASWTFPKNLTGANHRTKFMFAR